MTERELEARLIHEQIPLPNGFDARQEAALCRAMAQTRGVVHRPKRTLLLAAALMLLTGAAFAAGGRGLAFFWRQASPEAERLIERGLRSPAVGWMRRSLSFAKRCSTEARCKRSSSFGRKTAGAP